ncbi:MAG: hypothetical protein HY606_13980 [Planctomycetes bacterium]|nr:hypothetical protein [Planctomycetota bacterium]
MVFLKRNLPLLICFVGGLFFALTFYSPTKFSSYSRDMGSNAFNIISAIGTFFGILYVIVYNVDRVRKGDKGFGFSLILIVALFVTFVSALFSHGEYLTLEGQLSGIGWIFMYMYVPLQATMFSLLGFFIASAAYRAFRIKNYLSLILFLTATIVILGRIPFVNDLYKLVAGQHAIPLSEYVSWILQNPSMIAQRAIQIGITLGMVVVSIKTILGIDKSWLGKE